MSISIKEYNFLSNLSVVNSVPCFLSNPRYFTQLITGGAETYLFAHAKKYIGAYCKYFLLNADTKKKIKQMIHDDCTDNEIYNVIMEYLITPEEPDIKPIISRVAKMISPNTIPADLHVCEINARQTIDGADFYNIDVPYNNDKKYDIIYINTAMSNYSIENLESFKLYCKYLIISNYNCKTVSHKALINLINHTLTNVLDRQVIVKNYRTYRSNIPSIIPKKKNPLELYYQIF